MHRILVSILFVLTLSMPQPCMAQPRGVMAMPQGGPTLLDWILLGGIFALIVGYFIGSCLRRIAGAQSVSKMELGHSRFSVSMSTEDDASGALSATRTHQGGGLILPVVPLTLSIVQANQQNVLQRKRYF